MQKDFMSDTWDDVKKSAAGKKIFLFGAGNWGRKVWRQINNYDSSWNVVGFLDNDAEKQGQERHRIKRRKRVISLRGKSAMKGRR